MIERVIFQNTNRSNAQNYFTYTSRKFLKSISSFYWLPAGSGVLMRMKSLDYTEKTILQFTFYSSAWEPRGFIWCFHFGLTFSTAGILSRFFPSDFHHLSPLFSPPFFFFFFLVLRLSKISKRIHFNSCKYGNEVFKYVLPCMSVHIWIGIVQIKWSQKPHSWLTCDLHYTR